MEIFTMAEFQERWDEMIGRVENGEKIGIVNEDGSAAIMIPADDDLMQIYYENNNEAQ